MKSRRGAISCKRGNHGRSLIDLPDAIIATIGNIDDFGGIDPIDCNRLGLIKRSAEDISVLASSHPVSGDR